MTEVPVSWEPVRELFEAQVAVERLHPGAALAVYHHGKLIIDLVAGLADTQRGVPFLTNGFRPARYALATDAAGHRTVTLAPDDTGARRERMLSDAVRAVATRAH